MLLVSLAMRRGVSRDRGQGRADGPEPLLSLRRLRWIPMLLSFLAPASSSAQALERGARSALGLAFGPAGAITTRGAAAILENPAGLDPERAEASLGVGVSLADITIQRTSAVVNQALREARDQAGPLVAPLVALAVPLVPGRFVVGLGYTFALRAESFYPAYPEANGSISPVQREDPTRYGGTELSLTVHRVSLGAAIAFRLVTFGAALELDAVRLRTRRTFFAGLKADAKRLEDPSLDVDATLSGRTGIGATALLGLALRPARRLEVDVAVRLPAHVSVEEAVDLLPGSRPPEGTSEIFARLGSARLTLDLPLEVTLAAALALGPVRLLAGGSYARTSTLGDLAAELEGADLVLKRGRSFERHPLSTLPLGLGLRDQLGLHGGLELRLLEGFLALRLGYSYYRGATDPDAPSPVLLDLDRHVLGLGVDGGTRLLRAALSLSQDIPETRELAGSRAMLVNLLDSSVSEVVGKGKYRAAATRLMLELRVSLETGRIRR
jgi:hypothetical protein